MGQASSTRQSGIIRSERDRTDGSACMSRRRVIGSPQSSLGRSAMPR